MPSALKADRNTFRTAACLGAVLLMSASARSDEPAVAEFPLSVLRLGVATPAAPQNGAVPGAPSPVPAAAIEGLKKAVIPARAEELPRLIAELTDSRADVREQASTRLAASGRDAVTLLRDAGRAGSLETRVRVVKVLRDIYLLANEDNAEDTVDAAEAALADLAASVNASVSARAEAVLAQHYSVREKWALSRIQKLGGIITYQDELQGALGDDTEGAPRVVSHVILGKDWKAGDEGLKHIRRLSRLKMVYYIPDSGVTEAALKDLQGAIPNLIVQRRGRACLGVAGVTDPAGRGCQVMRVIEGSAAARARFQVGDVVMAFNGKNVDNFDKLIELIGETKPGDKIKVEVLRDFQKTTLEPVMDEWKQ